MSAHRFWRAATHLLLFTGLTITGYLGMTWAEASIARKSGAAEWLVAPEVEVPANGRTLGRLEVPRLGVASLVVQGDDEKSLLVGVGHLADTVLPWQDGNTVLAGHRDTDFRPLKDIRAGDAIRFQTATATYDYVVREISIVEPTDLRPLRATPGPTLTLITCYPFTFVGSAPSRFIVHAERTNVRPTFGPSPAKTS
jgi:sortase A